MVSPAPSQDLSTPTSSNARSPATDYEWYSDSYSTPQIHDDVPFSNDMAYIGTDLGSACGSQPQPTLFAESARYGGVNLSQVQGFIDQQDFIESQDDVFEPDDRYSDIDQTELCIEVDTQDAEVPRTAFRQSHTSNVGPGMSDDADFIQKVDKTDAATEMDEVNDNFDEDEEMIEEEPTDTDYTPRSTRPRRRRATHSAKPLSATSRRRGRATKSKQLGSGRTTKAKDAFACKDCQSSFNDSDTLQQHLHTAHPRAFTCVFNFAGCTSTFPNKNEWKRHVSTQHLIFNNWVCNLGSCVKVNKSSSATGKNVSGGPATKGGMFNRKDLFTQHLRRMHAPAGTKRQGKPNPEWEETIKAHQRSCMQVNRHGPQTLQCPISECGILFSGRKCWDDRMEHVAKHLEEAANADGAITVRHDDDELLVKWALKERIVEVVGGKYKLISPGVFLETLDQDAEGEDDDEIM